MQDRDTAAARPIGRVLQNSTLYLAGNIAFKVVGFVMIPFYARHLSTEEYGVLNLLELATTVVALAFGLQSMAAAMTRVYNDHDQQAARNATISTALLGSIVLAGLVALLATVFAGPIGVAASLPGQAALLRWAFAAMFFSTLGEIVLTYERMRDRARFFLGYSMVSLVATLSLNILFIGYLHRGVFGFVASKLIVTSLGSVFLTWRTLREVGLSWDGAVARALARFAAPLIASGVSYFAIHFSDRLFLAHVSRAEVGVYSLVYTFAFLLSVLIGDSFSKSWGVSFYSLASGPGWQQRFVQVGRWLILVLGAGAVGISLFGRDVLIVMVPSSYYPPPMMLPVLTFGYFLREVGDFFGSMLLIGIGSGLFGRIAVAGAVLNLACNAVLIPRYGIWGAAWATFVTWAAYCMVCWVAAWRVHRVPMGPGALGVLLALSAIALGLRAVLGPSGLVWPLVVDCVAFSAFLAGAALVYLRPSERREVLAGLRHARTRVGMVAGRPGRL